MADPTPQNPLGMKSIAEVMTKSPAELYAETLKKGYTHDWIFGSWYEKLIIFACFCWSVWSLGSFLWRTFL